MSDNTQDVPSMTRRAALGATAGLTGFGLAGAASAASSDLELYVFGTERYAEHIEEHTDISWQQHLDIGVSRFDWYWDEVEDGSGAYELDTTAVTDESLLVPEDGLGDNVSERLWNANLWIHDTLDAAEHSPNACHVLDWFPPGDKTIGLAQSATLEDYTDDDDVYNTSISRVDAHHVDAPDDYFPYYKNVDEFHHVAHEVLHLFGGRHATGKVFDDGTGTVMIDYGHEHRSKDEKKCGWDAAEAEHAETDVSHCTVDEVRDWIY